MPSTLPLVRRAFIATVLLAPAIALPVIAQERPGRAAGDGIVIGLEYQTLDSQRLVASMAAAFAETGMPGMKHYVEAVQWGEMQKGPDVPIDFTKFDWFVGEYQKQGFTELTISLRPASTWGSKHAPRIGSRNLSPRPEYREHFRRWIAAVVERYDHDGVDDMPGLRWPIRYVEIGNEFSSYQPEPVEEYLETLKLAYEAAHSASPAVLVGHAAFLTTPVNLDVPDPKQYDKIWATTRRVDRHHDLADMRKILDHPELFDFINLHNLGDPYEIEHQMRWLAYETGRRGYTRPVIISDTLPTPYAGWGAATVCRGLGLAVMVPPARERDRCRLAAYFTRMVNGDPSTVAWTRGFVAADHVQRAIIAAEQGIRVINLSFVADLPFATAPAFRAGSGIAAWGGAVRVNLFTGTIQERYPLYHAIRQLTGHLQRYSRVTRVRLPDEQARVYRIDRPAGPVWIAWRDPRGIILPEDGAVTLEVDLPVPGLAATLEPVITELGQQAARPTSAPVTGGSVRLRLTHTPVWVTTR
jgi:hypothetical protein